MKIWKNDVRLKFKFSLEVSGIFKDLVVPSMKTVLLLSLFCLKLLSQLSFVKHGL